MKNILLILLTTPFLLNALSYQETVMAYEEALENQSAYVYEMKYQRQQEINRQTRESYARLTCEYKQKKIDKMVEDTNKRLDSYK